MGVKLTKILESCCKPIELGKLLSKKIAVDAFNYIYQFMSAIRGQDGNPLTDYQGRVTSHLSGILSRNIGLMENDIKLIWVFDGQPNMLKAEEIKKRKDLRKIAEKNLENAIDDQNSTDAQKFAKGTTKITSDIIEESKTLLELMGIPVVQAQQDGEAQCAYMIQKNLAWACASQDYDAFLFGANRIIRNLSASKTKVVHNKTTKVEIEYYTLEECLESLKITQFQLIDMGILIGVDFFEGIKGIGDKTAYDMILDYGNIETIKREKGEKYNFSVLTPEFLEEVRDIFLHPKISDDISLKWNRPNLDKITELLVEEHNFNKERLTNQLNRLKEKFLNKTQGSLDSFYHFKC